MPEPSELDPRLFRASALATASRAVEGDAVWPPPGRLVELAGGLDDAVTSAAVEALARAQHDGAIAAWLQPERGLLFPPDLAANGVDLDALVVVQVPARPDGARRGRAPKHAGHELPKAAELLLRSGAFDLLVLDLRPMPPPPGAWLGRLQALARTHRTRVLLLSDMAAPVAAGSTAMLRVVPRRRRERAAFVVEPRIVRDKLHDATAPPAAERAGPVGLL